MESKAKLSARERAEKRVEELQGFWAHLVSYLLVNTGLFAINWFTNPEYWWFVFPVIGWGVGLLSHGIFVFGWGAGWRERKIRELTEKYEKEG
jgi:hypothetical protein